MSGSVTNILLAGVGGQGTIFVSKVITLALVKAGYDVKMSEVHGMSQRGGSVSTQVRYGPAVASPIVGKGSADILVAFEKLEALRYSPWLKPEGILIVNGHEIPPMPVASGAMPYPQDVLERLGASFATIVVDAASIAARIGNPKTMNVVLLGAMVEALGMESMDWIQALGASVPAKAMEDNRAAFSAGREAYRLNRGRRPIPS
ncbi:MAG TPA: indolepyruvate oxidoreductase subunit beta [Rectinemataceae bacterium]